LADNAGPQHDGRRASAAACAYTVVSWRLSHTRITKRWPTNR
jgi:hypothetical protein